jgi:hypothetical protein
LAIFLRRLWIVRGGITVVSQIRKIMRTFALASIAFTRRACANDRCRR